MNRILIVDDHEDNLYYLQALLGGHGYVVETARHGAEALVKARQAPPDAIISDLLMPVMDGYTLLRLWKADERLKPIPFLVYTATYTKPEDERLALSLGADAFILKPSEPEDFLSRLQAVREQAGRPPARPPQSAIGDEKELLTVYSETLIRKLEEKSLQLQEANTMLREDITRRQQMEEELRWKTAFLEAQVDSSPDGILVVDAAGKVIQKNRRLLDLWQLPPELAANGNHREQMEFAANRTKHPKEYLDQVATLTAHQDEVSHDEIELVDDRILDRYSSPVRDQAGRYYGRIWTFRDITQQRKLEQQYRQAQKMEAFGQLAGGVAHDFNNILAVIQLQAELLRSDTQPTPQQIECASEIEHAAYRGTNLTRQLLLFSRKQNMQPRNLNLKETVQDFSKILSRTLGEHIQLEFQFDERPLLLRADPGMIDQILLNLAVNARDAMPNGGRITIATSTVEIDVAVAAQNPQARCGHFVCLSVTDTGTGISPEVLPRIFEPFFTTKEIGKGTGLGLATVFGILQQHKGWVNVDSEVGRGTTFQIYLPRLLANPETKPATPLADEPRGNGETILFVEDDASLCRSVRAILQRLGYQVLAAGNGDEALQRWEQHHSCIDLLITDLVMPGNFSGRELAKRLSTERPGLKVIFTSGYCTEAAAKDMVLKESVNLITKPYDVGKLARIIRARLDGSPK
jgi:signal transduction histidine kinase